MNASKTLQIGDKVYFDYGCMCGSDFGTVIGMEETAFGVNVWVRKQDFSMTTVENLNGEVTATIYHVDGDDVMSARGVLGIGAYKVSKLHNTYP